MSQKPTTTLDYAMGVHANDCAYMASRGYLACDCPDFGDAIERYTELKVLDGQIKVLDHLYDRADGERSARKYTALTEQRLKVLRERRQHILDTWDGKA